MTYRIEPLEVPLRRVFVVAGAKETLKRNWFAVFDELGLGEAAGSIHYGASPGRIGRELASAAEYINTFSPSMDEYLATLDGTISSQALCALSTAWHDYLCKQEKCMLFEHFDLPAPSKEATSVTVSIGDEQSLRKILADRRFTSIKIKMDARDDRLDGIIDAIAGAEETTFRIDANGSWTMEVARNILDRLPLSWIELIEQPFGGALAGEWKKLRKEFSIPLFMDESVASADDINRIAPFVDGVNIKLQKSGRLETAMAVMRAARDEGLRVMLGCMIETSVGIAAAYHLSGLADIIDLDGRWLLQSDPFTGLEYNGAHIQISGTYGHGVTLA